MGESAVIKIGSKCCGCTVCVNSCPVHALKITTNNGFAIPGVDDTLCNDCGICERVCPVIQADNLKSKRSPLTVILAKNKNIVERKRSSSGGVFFPAANAILAGGGTSMVHLIQRIGRLSTVYHLTLMNVSNIKDQSMYRVTYQGFSMT